MGLSPLLVSEIFDIIQEINKQGVTILLVEQNAKKSAFHRKPRLCPRNRTHRKGR